MSKYTQGKWEVGQKCHDGIRIEVDGKCSVANVWGDNNEANAQLIASAPELLKALERLVERIDVNGGIGEYKGGPVFVMKAAREAITKAKEA